MKDQTIKADEQPYAGPRKANECVRSVNHLGPAEKLFGGFWHEGEIALLFGAPGTGKSVLAMQVAEAIARGRPIDGIEMPRKRQRVLYVDLQLSAAQFAGRYSHGRKRYKFSENLHWDRPPSDAVLSDWLSKAIKECGARVVVLDDLSAVRTTCDGTRETLRQMRELRVLVRETGVSILVLAGAREPRRRHINESDLMRSRVLCDAADSVFGIGRTCSEHFFVAQTRSRRETNAWNAADPCRWQLERSADGFLGLRLTGRTEEPGLEVRPLISDIKHLHDNGLSYTQIAEKLNISRSKAVRLCKKWTPEMETRPAEIAVPVEDDHDEIDEFDESVYDAEIGLDAEDDATGHSTYSDDPPPPEPFIDADPLGHLERSFDTNGREIFVEREDERGKPVTWYRRDTQGKKLLRCERHLFGITTRHVDGPLRLISP